jgi:phosphoserine phosphatase RsbU/P
MLVRGRAIRALAADAGVAAGLVTILLLAALDAAVRVQLTGGYAIGAIVASLLTSSSRTAFVAVIATAVAMSSGLWNGDSRAIEYVVRLAVCIALGSLAVYSARVRERREASFRRMAVIAETAQRAVLRATPTAVGSVGFATRYISASEEASVGGDLYEIVETPFGVRVIVGDVRGKGLAAVQTAASVLGAFRQAALTEPDPAALARAVDAVVSRLIDEEEFITALFAEFRADSVVLANCGHHPPLLIEEQLSSALDTGEPTPPLGLEAHPELVEHPWPVLARLLIYTDGLIETRDRHGEFFSVEAQAAVLGGRPLGEALDEMVSRLRTFAGGRILDDVALVLAENRAGLTTTT